MRQYSLVKVVLDSIPPDRRQLYPFKEGGVYVFLGEIPNMAGHCVVAEYPSGVVLSGYHMEIFKEIKDNET